MNDPVLPATHGSPEDAGPAGAPAAGQRLEYDGARGPVAKIAVSNALLTLATLGAYRFWGKTRMRRYLWSRGLLPGRPGGVHRHRAGAPSRFRRGARRARPPRRGALRDRDGDRHRPPVLLGRTGHLFPGGPVPRLRGRVSCEALSPDPHRMAQHPLRPGWIEPALRTARAWMGRRDRAQPGDHLRGLSNPPPALPDDPHQLRGPPLRVQGAGEGPAEDLAPRLALPAADPRPHLPLVPGEGIPLLRREEPLRRPLVRLRSRDRLDDPDRRRLRPVDPAGRRSAARGDRSPRGDRVRVESGIGGGRFSGPALRSRSTSAEASWRAT